jgi:hypothetical protein
MQVTLWSPVHGQTATTANTVAISVMTALIYNIKTMITHTHFNKNTLEATLLDKSFLKSDLVDLTDTGMDAITRNFKLSRTDPDMIKNYTTTILKNRLDILIGTQTPNRDIYMQGMEENIQKIIEAVEKSYQLAFVDLSSGISALSQKLMDKSDLIIINLCQNLHILDDFFKNDVLIKYFAGKNCFYVISRYDVNSRLNLKAIKKRYGIKRNLFSIPYCSEFSDALGFGKTVEFLMKEISCEAEDVNYRFIEDLNLLVQRIVGDLGLDGGK